jgi:antitoxin (DNA-binding transcriptional repressor) of toxin-antitoxin stability system
MRTATIRELRHDTTTVLGWVASGESVDVQRRGVSVALLSPQKRKQRILKPDFLARIKAAYGDKILSTPATDLVSEYRGDR